MTAEMAEPETEDEVESEAEEDSFEYFPQVTAHAPSGIEGNIVGYRLAIDEDAEKTGHNVAVIIEDPEVTRGSAWKNRDAPDGFTSIGEYNDLLAMAEADPDDDDYAGGREVTAEAVEDAQQRLAEEGIGVDESEQIDGTDYKLAGGDGNDVKTYQDDVIGIDVGGGTFDSEQTDTIDEDAVMVWYGGIVGQFLARSLDFNGMPFAYYNDDSYLVKGLLQPPLGWRSQDVERYDVETTDRSTLAAPKDSGGKGRPPRIARPIVLRDELDDNTAEIRLGWYDDAQRRRNFDGLFVDDEELDLSNAYSDDSEYDFPDAVIEDRLDVDDADTVYNLYHGEGWQPKPDGVTVEEDTSGGSFDMDVSGDGSGSDDADDENPSGLSETEQQFAETLVGELEGTGKSHAEVVTIVETNVANNIDNFDTDDPDTGAIQEYVIENVPNVDA